MTTVVTEDQVHQALNLWHQGDAQGTPLADLLLWQQAQIKGALNVRRATNQLLLDALAALASEDPQAQRVLELRFLREETGQQIANAMHWAEGTVWRKQREAIARLTTIIQTQEAAAHAARLARFAGRLPGDTGATLFGIDAHLAALTAQINHRDAPWILAIEGIGG
ncbi:MAG: hypothetical protein KDE31_18630, partial [Caldilineaceae bacterium]|nr:hypothetical protein [Caldilineaceae bacterium]